MVILQLSQKRYELLLLMLQQGQKTLITELTSRKFIRLLVPFHILLSEKKLSSKVYLPLVSVQVAVYSNLA